MAGGGGKGSTFSTRAAARILAVSPDRIRYWVKRRLIRPSSTDGRQFRFAFNDLLVMRLAKELLPGRRHLEPIQRCLERIRTFLGPTRTVTSLRLSNEDGRILVRERGAVFEAESGQLILDFDPPRPPAAVEDHSAAKGAREANGTGQNGAAERMLACQLLSELIANGKRNAEVHLTIAAVLERDGDLAAALKHLLSAATIEPSNAEVHERLGLLYRKRQEDERALASFLRAVERNPDALQSHQNLAELYEHSGRKRDALRHLSAVHRLLRDG